MSYWKNKVVPKFKKLFDKSKKKSASETCKSFNSSKESFDKEIEDNRSDLHPKVVEIYRSTTVISKKLMKEPSEPAVKENSDPTQNILSELAKAGFPQAQFLHDAGTKSGPALLSGPIVYLFQKTSTFLVDEPLPEMPNETREIDIAPKTEETKEAAAAAESGDGMASTEKAEPSEGTKEAAPVDIKEERAAGEAKEEEIDPVEAKKEVVEQIETEVETVKPAAEGTAEKTPAKEEMKEEKKEDVPAAAPSPEAKK